MLLLALATVWFEPPGATAAASEPATPVVAAPAVATPFVLPEVTLSVLNRDVFTFRSSALGVSPPDRVRRAKLRIDDQLKRPGPHKVTLKQEPFGVLILIDGGASFVVTADDVDKLQQESLDAAAARAAAALQLVIRETRESRDLDAILRAVGVAIAVTMVAAGVVWVLVRVRRWLERRLIDLSLKHAETVRLGGVVLLRRDRVRAFVHLGLTLLFRLLMLVAVYEWLSFLLRQFPFTRPWGEILSSFLFDFVAEVGSTIVRAVPGLLTALVIVFLARYITQLIDLFVERARAGQLRFSWLDDDVAQTTRRIAKGVVWLLALAAAYPYLPGAQTEAFKGLSVLLGLMISLGASSLVGQAAAGLILTYGRVYRKGEYVRIADQGGTVTEMGIFNTRIRTGRGEELTISNSAILAGTISNYSRTVKGSGFVVDTTVTIGYDTPWRQVHAMLIEAAGRTPGVLAEPAPTVFQTALSDWYPEYRLVCQALPAEPGPRAMVLSALHANIQDVFNQYGVQIMSPQYFQDPERPKVVPPEKWFPPPVVR
jgi:small-conductance mechanosensitive channel